MTSVSVIIVNWNSDTLLTKCLQHLENQTIIPSHIYVIDNASSDDSATNVESFTNITMLKMDSNLGFAAGNNAALNQCDTEFIALLNPDAFPEPNWLKSLLEAAVAHPETVAFGSRQLRDGSPGVLDGIGDSYQISGRMFRRRYGGQQQARDLVQQEIFSPCAAAALYRLQPVIDSGGFDEDFFCYVEDVDLGFRLRLAGYKSMYVPEAVIRHVGAATSGGPHSDFAVYHGHRNLVWTYVKNMPSFLFWLLLPLHISLNIGSIIAFAFRGQGAVILRSKRDACLGLPKMWRKRKKIQGARVASIKDVWRQLDKRMILTKLGRLK
jgi:GT2 family glycosyltransferase